MCMQEKTLQMPPSVQAGYAYKVVNDTHYWQMWQPIYPLFLADGSGGSGSNPGKEVLPAENIIYALFQTTTVRPRIFARTYADVYGNPGEKFYPAGIHLYKDLERALREISFRKDKSIIKCHFHKAVAEDEETIVALEITPVDIYPFQEV